MAEPAQQGRQTPSGAGRLRRSPTTALAFPATILGSWLGARLYHALSDRHFSDVVLGLLFLSGLGLLWSTIGPR